MRAGTLVGSLVLFLMAGAVSAGCDKPAVSPEGSSSGTAAAVTGAPAATDTGAPAVTGAPAGTGAPAATETGAPAATDPPHASASELRFAGTWSSPSCGDRTYERRLTLKEDKTFRAEERVSPCPPKVQCVWSGILYWNGTFVTNEKGLVLTKTGGADSGRGGKIESPLTLEVDKASGALMEARGGAKCPYTRMAADGGPKGSEPSSPSSPSSM